MEYLANALLQFSLGNSVHPIEVKELLERGMVKYADTPQELALTEAGTKHLEYVKSVDFASKRY